MLKFTSIFCIVARTMKNTIAVRIMNRNLLLNVAVRHRGLNLISTQREDLIMCEEFCLVGYEGA
jgi:hypothetical protein